MLSARIEVSILTKEGGLIDKRRNDWKIVTTDSHQGELARQIIAKHGITTEYLSVEEKKDRYYNLKNLILTESLEGHENSILVGELRRLKDGVKKVEKVKGSTDDLSDAICGACWSCFNDGFFKFNDEEVMDLVDILNNRPKFNDIYTNPY